MANSADSSFVHPPCSYEETLIKKVVQTHAPDGRHIDSGLLLRLTEEIFRCITTEKGTNLLSMEELAWADEQNELGRAAHLISSEIAYYNSGDQSTHATTIDVLELLGVYSWGVKVTIVLAALGKCYGEFWLMLQLSASEPLALLIARLRGFQSSLEAMQSVGHIFKAVRYLFEKMVDVAHCISEFEILPDHYATLDVEAMTSVKAHIHLTSYWLIRSSVTCASQITSMIALSSEQMYGISVSAKWELWSAALKMDSMHNCLRKKFHEFHLRADEKINSILSYLFEEVHDDNQQVLTTLFSMKDDFPFAVGSSLRKAGVAELIDKVVILLISRPMIQLEKFLLIVQQLQSRLNNKPRNLYEIVWVPISSQIPMSEAEKRSFFHIISTWPWYSLSRASMLSSPVLKFIREAWHFHDDPLMVVLDSKGRVVSLNAFDMVAIWGELAYPFTDERETILWEGERLTFEILLNGLDPLLSYWMEDGRTICFYGSIDTEWVRELTTKIKRIKEAGIPLDLIYIGSNNSEQSKDILATIIVERLSRYLSPTQISIFWLRLESIRNSRSRLGFTIESDGILREVTSLFSFDMENKGWLLVCEGARNEILRLSGNEVFDCLSCFHIWGEKINKLGFTGSIRNSLLPPLTMDQCSSYIIPYSEEVDERNIVCENCKRPMEKHYMYQCSN